jgi:hypothetical protein
MLVGLEPASVRCLFRPVSAYGHAAPSPRTPACVVGEQQGAGRSFARLDVREIFRADKTRHRFRDRQKKRLRGMPPAYGLERERPATVIMLHCYPSESLILRQQTV